MYVSIFEVRRTKAYATHRCCSADHTYFISSVASESDRLFFNYRPTTSRSPRPKSLFPIHLASPHLRAQIQPPSRRNRRTSCTRRGATRRHLLLAKLRVSPPRRWWRRRRFTSKSDDRNAVHCRRGERLWGRSSTIRSFTVILIRTVHTT